MRCVQCGTMIKNDPVWSNGLMYCSLECAEEARILEDDLVTREHNSGISSLFGNADDDDY